MRLAIIGDRGIPARYSGFSTLTEQLGLRMVEQYGIDVTIYCRRNYYDQRPRTYKGVNCVYLPAPGGKSLESIVHTNLSILHAIFCRYDLVFVLDPGNAPFVLLLRARGYPIVMHTDGMGWKRTKWSNLQRKYYKWSERVACWFSHWLVTDSKAMQAYYLDEYETRSSFIPYAGKISDAEDESILEQHGLVPNGYYLCVARIEPENNVDLIIREYRRVKTSRPLVVVGSARYESSYGKAIAAENDDSVKCIGGVYDKNKLNALFSNAYVYLHGHEVGGTNPSLLNAMHLSAAPVAMDVVFHREVMTHDGLYFTKREGHLSSIIEWLDQDEAEVIRIRQLAKLRSDSYYRWDAVADAYVDLFEVVANKYRNRQALETALTSELYEPLKFFEGNKSAG